MFLGFAVVAILVTVVANWQLAALITGVGSLAAPAGVAYGHQGFCATAQVQPESTAGPEFRILPWAFLAVPSFIAVRAVDQFPETSVVTISMLVAALGFAWAIYSGCKSIASARSAG